MMTWLLLVLMKGESTHLEVRAAPAGNVISESGSYPDMSSSCSSTWIVEDIADWPFLDIPHMYYVPVEGA